MKKRLQQLAERIDASPLRERVLLFCAAAMILLVTLNLALIEPQFRLQRRLSSEIAQKQAETATLQEQVTKMVRARDADPDREAHARLERLKLQIAEAERRVAAEEARFTAPAQMKEVVEELLSRNRGVRLLDMKTVAAAPVVDPKAAPQGGPASQVYRHGIEVTVAGRYLDVLEYVAQLEKLPTQLYWGSIELTVVEYPNLTARLVIYTLSLDKSWMSV